MRPWGQAAAKMGAGVAVLLLSACQSPTALDQLERESRVQRAVAHPQGWLAAGRIALEAGEFALAQESFERSIIEDGPSAAAFTGAGIAAERQGLVTLSSRYFKRAREMAPESVLANNNLGVVLFRLKEYYPARQAFQAAFALSDGRNQLAIENLRKVETAIAEIEAGNHYVDPAVNFDVQRLGSSEYALVGTGEPEPLIGAGRTLAVEDEGLEGDVKFAATATDEPPAQVRQDTAGETMVAALGADDGISFDPPGTASSTGAGSLAAMLAAEDPEPAPAAEPEPQPVTADDTGAAMVAALGGADPAFDAPAPEAPLTLADEAPKPSGTTTEAMTTKPAAAKAGEELLGVTGEPDWTAAAGP